MAEHQINQNEAGQVDFDVHARDYTRMIKLLKYGAIASVILAFLVLLIIAN
ncbi:aa3-type cytochrome c oxidase subunit IV [Sphingomonas sp. GCM10030256]|uniref:aa3-type cytochrome c oxidase subunit IV n=1 Tax=Sphingomonas sp. GCM10030256 TaxID=3273427 RepID=UPI003607F65B